MAALSPWVIAEVAARRARRKAAQVLYRYRGVTPVEALCRAYGVSSVEELPAAALDRRTHVWCDVSQRANTLSALSQKSGALTRAIARAEAAAHLQFDVFGTKVAFDERVDWSVDPVSGYRYPELPATELPLLHAGADPKFPWALGRLDHLIALGQGYWAATDREQRRRYAQAFVRSTRDFLSSNRLGVGIQWTCAMEVSLRAANLAMALKMFADAEEARDPGFVADVLSALANHCFFVEAHLEDTGRVPNNHLVSNHVGILVASVLFPELPGAVDHIANASSALREDLDRQVHPDGWSFEGSVPYHRLAVELFTLGYVVTQQCGLELGSEYAERLRKMFEVSLAYCSEEGLAPQIGDNDSGRVFPLVDRAANDHGYLPSLGAALFSDGALKQNGELCDEALWLLGNKGLSRFSRLPCLANPLPIRSDESGIHVLRSDDAVVTVSAGANGQRGIGGHNHNDKLSFELHVHGVPVIVDSGTGTYTRQPEVRNAFRSIRAHATVEVDGKDQAPLSASRLFFLEDRARCRVTDFRLTHDRQILAAQHSAFEGITLERRFELRPADHALVVSDLLKGTGVHTVLTRFPLPNGLARLRPLTDGERVRLASLTGEEMGDEVVEIGPAEAPLAVLALDKELHVSLEPSSYSPGYGEVVRSICVTGAVRARLPRALTVCVLWSSRD